MRDLRRLSWLGLFLLTGCVTLPPISPLADVGDRQCDRRPLTGGAPLLSPEKGTNHVISVDLGLAAPCLREAAGPASLYTAFELPLSGPPGVATVSGVPAGETLFAPRVLLLDAEGHTNREIPLESFMFRGAALTALIRLRPEDRVLVVASTPGATGHPFERVQEGIQSNAIYGARAVYRFNTGTETTNRFVFSHTGRISVTIEPLPSAQLSP